MKDIIKTKILLLLIIAMASCNSLVSPPRAESTEIIETALVEAKTSIARTQAAIPALTFTPALTPTLTQMSSATPALTAYAQIINHDGSTVWVISYDTFNS